MIRTEEIRLPVTNGRSAVSFFNSMKTKSNWDGECARCVLLHAGVP